jgi:hypothetical protein
MKPRVKWLIVLGALAVGCIKNVPGASRPEVADNGGTWTCAQIVDQCDRDCNSIACLDQCTARGTVEAQQQHNAVVSCGQHSFCTNEDCMRANCAAEMQTCAGDQQVPPADPPPTGPDAPQPPPDQQPQPPAQ